MTDTTEPTADQIMLDLQRRGVIPSGQPPAPDRRRLLEAVEHALVGLFVAAIALAIGALLTQAVR